MKKNDEIEIGSKIYISGGYDYEIKWLNGREGYDAIVKDFIPGQNKQKAMLIEFDEVVITADKQKGKYAVLELRYYEAEWNNEEIVHIELCDFIPEKKKWDDRKKGVWVESNAKVEKMK
jgi:hypothetical protein